jgi:hypothetical protein
MPIGTKPNCIRMAVVYFANGVVLIIAAVLVACIFCEPGSRYDVSVFYGKEPALACEPRLQHSTLGVMSPSCDRSVRCIGALCIGSEHGASNYEALDEANVTHIISAINGCASRSDKRPCLNLDLNDDMSETGIIDALFLAISWHRAEHNLRAQCLSDRCGSPGAVGKFFVHCAAGVSRSSTIVIALMQHDNPALTTGVALDLLRSARAVVQPNRLFILALNLVSRIPMNNDQANCALKAVIASLYTETFECECQPRTCEIAQDEHSQFRRQII